MNNLDRMPVTIVVIPISSGRSTEEFRKVSSYFYSSETGVLNMTLTNGERVIVKEYYQIRIFED